MIHDDLRVILDTDIGSDVDDAIALAVLLGTPKLDLMGATTVYGDTALRARVLLRYANLAGRTVPTFVGETHPLSGRDVWWTGLEGSLHAGLQSEQPESAPASEFLRRSVRARPAEIDIVAIGPLTNLAVALDSDPAFAADVRHLSVMGGIFGDSRGIDGTGIEHNFRSDDIAARSVLSAGIPTTVTGAEMTELITIGPEQLSRLEAAGALGRALAADITQWWGYWKRARSSPHDPIAVLTLTRPELFDFTAWGRIEIEVGGSFAGRSTFVPDPTGTTRLVSDLDAPAVVEAIVSGIETAAAAAARAAAAER